MAKIVQVITRPESEYNLQVAESQVRDLDAIVEKLNTTYQEDLYLTLYHKQVIQELH